MPARGDGLTSHLRRRFPPGAYVGVELEVNQSIVVDAGRRWTALRGVLIDSLRSGANWRLMMQIRVGFEMIYDCPQPTPMIFNVNVHFTRVSDLVGRDDLAVRPAGPDGSLSRQLRQLVHPHRRAEGPHARLRRRDRERQRRARRDRSDRRNRFRCRTCPRKRCCFCSEAGTAKPIGCPRRRGSSSGRRRRDGAACRRSATSSIGTSSSATSTRA